MLFLTEEDYQRIIAERKQNASRKRCRSKKINNATGARGQHITTMVGEGEAVMQGTQSLRAGLFVAFLVFLPVASFAQNGTIAGVVKDTSGAVLPGVSVEASSPALIEKVRTVVTDNEGQYKILDLRPGTYAVTFTLAGFSVVRREGIELSASFTATVNAELARRRPGGDGHGVRGESGRGYPERGPAESGHPRLSSIASRAAEHTRASPRSSRAPWSADRVPG